MDYKILSGSTHPSLSLEIAQHLKKKLTPTKISFFPDGEKKVSMDESVKGSDVVVIQSLSPQPESSLFELLMILDALKRVGATKRIVVIPYLAYARQDRQENCMDGVAAKLIANLLERAGATHIVSMDLHAEQISGFFDLPLLHLSAVPLLAQTFLKREGKKPLIVAPDLGALKRAHHFAALLEGEIAVLDKKRLSSTSVSVEGVIGQQIKDREVLIVDDLCATGATLIEAARVCREAKARSICAAVVHGVLVRDLKWLVDSPLETLYLTDSLPPADEEVGVKKVVRIKAASLLADGIKDILIRG